MKISASKHFSAEEEVETMKEAALFLIDVFHSERYVKTKIKNLNAYFKEHNITDAVIGISGGLDSAVVFKLLKLCDVEVHPLFVPIYNTLGIVNQDVAAKYAKELTKCITINISEVAYELINALDLYETWGIGQAQYLLRVPVFYGYVAKLQEQGKNPVVFGTTNKSEALLGYFGKTSDNAVDIQPIWDLSKGRELLVAEYLGVPECIIKRKPTGDTPDGLTDEEIFGFPYWFLEVWDIFRDHPWHQRVLEFRKKNSHKFNSNGEPKTSAVII